LNDLEEEFLAAFHDKFFDGNGRTYQDIGARLLQLRAKKIPDLKSTSVGGEQVCWLADKQIMQKESVRRLIRKLKQNGVSPLTDKQRVQSLSVVERPLVAQSGH
jgi:hypothetical protein